MKEKQNKKPNQQQQPKPQMGQPHQQQKPQMGQPKKQDPKKK